MVDRLVADGHASLGGDLGDNSGGNGANQDPARIGVFLRVHEAWHGGIERGASLVEDRTGPLGIQLSEEIVDKVASLPEGFELASGQRATVPGHDRRRGRALAPLGHLLELAGHHIGKDEHEDGHDRREGHK